MFMPIKCYKCFMLFINLFWFVGTPNGAQILLLTQCSEAIFGSAWDAGDQCRSAVYKANTLTMISI